MATCCMVRAHLTPDVLPLVFGVRLFGLSACRRRRLQCCRHFATDAVRASAYRPRSTPKGGATRRGSIPPDGGAALKTRIIDPARPLCDDAHTQTISTGGLMADTIIENPILNSPYRNPIAIGGSVTRGSPTRSSRLDGRVPT